MELRDPKQFMERYLCVQQIDIARQYAQTCLARARNERLRRNAETVEVEQCAPHLVGGSDEYQRVVMRLRQDGRDVARVLIGRAAALFENDVRARHALA